MLDYNVVMSEIAKQKMIIDEAENVLKDLKNSLKQYMTENHIEEIIGEEHKAKYRSIDKYVIDTNLLKEEHPRIAKKYTVNRPYMRLDVV